MPNPEAHMRRAIELAKKNPSQPFGCVIVDRQNNIVSEAFNDGENPVRHGETAAIYDLASKGTDSEWRDLTLYTTAEPCPMCAGAVLWSGIGRVVIGTSIETLVALGLPQIDIPLHEVLERASEDFTPPEVEAGFLEAECDALYRSIS
ncbi:nucleoside deaminase [Rubrobacter indicoceani]|uniref:nucleoside deaminase n=1 Tax=Rubrobacter indicoceani TaxID=2051957 RepID=UPI000E5AC6D3|nr:nucleoside deaminase [Rubrobacter indicoceani]